MISAFEETLTASSNTFGSNISGSMGNTVKVEMRGCCDPGWDRLVPDLQMADLQKSELPKDVVHVWAQPLEVPTPVVEFCYEMLSSEERQRAARYRVGRPRTDFILTRGTLRSLIASYLGMTPQGLAFRYSEHGKPLLNGPFDLRFNVSHTDGLALMALAKGREIGVDVEKITTQPDARKLAERFFSVRERESLKTLSGEDLHAAFFRCWTRKEAYVKAIGEGLSLPLHQFDVSVAADESQALLATRPDPSEASRWTLRDLPAGPGYAAALAVSETVSA
jgi:4'-phosphopantetheinyl transferase